MSIPPLDLSKYYWIDDDSSAAVMGTRLNNILGLLAKGQSLTGANRDFLVKRGLSILVRLADGELSGDQFNQLACAAREERITASRVQQQLREERRRADQIEADAREAAMWAAREAERVKRESAPAFIARQRNQALRYKYGVIDYVEECHFARLMALLRQLDARSRLSDESVVWLKTEGHAHATQEIMHAHHRLEADFHIAEYRRTGDIWQAVSASGHLRKCSASCEADELLRLIPDTRLKSAKLKSAVRTTHGGALRDLQRHDEAMKLGEEAHALLPGDFRPCTLLGAINIELGHMQAGHEWYCKAEKRGAKPDSVESELRALFARMAPEKHDALLSQLLRIDPARYGWLRRKSARD